MKGYNAIIENRVMHRNINMTNIYVNFDDPTGELVQLNEEDKLRFLKEVDLDTIDFELKLSGFGVS